MREGHLQLLTKIDEIINRTRGLAQKAEKAIKKSEKVSILTSNKSKTSQQTEGGCGFNSFRHANFQRVATEKKTHANIDQFENVYKSNPLLDSSQSSIQRRKIELEENIDKELIQLNGNLKGSIDFGGRDSRSEGMISNIQQDEIKALEEYKESLKMRIKEKQKEIELVSDEVVDFEVELSSVKNIFRLFYLKLAFERIWEKLPNQL